MAGQFFCFLFILSFGLFHIRFFFSQNFGCLYLGQKTAGEAIFASPVGPDTHNGPQQKEAASKPEQSLFCAENLFLKISKSS